VTAEPFSKVLESIKVVVMLGAGGVGKTTSAILVAMIGAMQGRRVALLSIDPARRLAAALGLPLGNQLKRIAFPESLGFKGSIDGAMLDQKAVFDAMVRRYAPSDQVAERILGHQVYRAISANLSGPLEYMALAKLHELSEDHRYDLIVLDTPPDTHALDFLARPNVLAGFMENKVMTWLIKPFLLAGKLGLGRLFSAGEKLMGGIAKVTGVTALHSFGEFLVLMQEVIEGFHSSGEKIVSLLSRPDTAFVLVTVPTSAAARSAVNLTLQLNEMNYEASAVIFNRCLPEPVRAELAANAPVESLLTRRLAGERRILMDLDQALRLAQRKVPRRFVLTDQDHDLGTAEALAELARQLERSGSNDQDF
jgi:anion-transporting  ArsA/GET3 family ATPase